MIRKWLTGTIAVVLMMVASTPAFAKDPVPNVAGEWATTDCAHWWEHEGPTDCGVWGDGSNLHLRITRGHHPLVVLRDDYSSACVAAGLPARAYAVGRGTFDSGQLWVNFAFIRCGSVLRGGFLPGYETSLATGEIELWEDPDGDGWGYKWARVDLP